MCACTRAYIVHADTHTHTHTHTHTQTQTHTYTHTNTNTHIHTHTLGVTMKNSLPSESSENTVLDEIQYGESNGGNRFSIGRSMTKLYIKINQNCGATRARKLLSTNAELNEMDPKL